ncbi:MAG: DNA polymerase III subunit delta [Armatimonadota bacterium]|nr:DNA polymerase III subunit delta [bacterium]
MSAKTTSGTSSRNTKATKTAKTDEPRAYLLRGDDEFQKQQRLSKILKTLVSPDFADFDLETMEGDTATSDRIITGLNIPPFSGKQRVVLVKYANKMHTEEQEKLASRLGQTPKSGCLVLVNPAAEKTDGRPKKGSEVIGDLSKAVRKIGEVVEFDRMRSDSATKFALSLFAEAGKKVSPQVAAALIQRVGTDSAILVGEAKKLIDYSGDSAVITEKEVAAVTSETPEEKIFKLVDAVATRNQAQALRFLDEIFENSDDPRADAPKTLATLARQFRLIWQMKFLVESGVKTFQKSAVPDEIKSILPSDPNILDVLGRQAWQADRIARQARPFSRQDLIRCFNAITKADLMLKSIEGDIEDPSLVMQLLVIELARGSQRR